MTVLELKIALVYPVERGYVTWSSALVFLCNEVSDLIRVLVVDDHDLVRTGIARMLADIDGLLVIGQADSGEEAIRAAKELKPDVILMDVRMPGIGGLEATRKLLRSHPHMRVIAVTACEEDPFPTRLLQAGAAGYLTKGAALGEMIQAIRLVFAGQRYISPQIAQQLALKSFQPQSSNSPFDLLSEREIQIALMIANCQKVQAISDKLCLSPKTVNTYRYRIFEKLSINSDVELVLLAVRHGMIDNLS
ncbi:DNA-binding NarL/FixJ family response regulator [Azomonas macrocytogenes]|uniref:DNA-binding NarL/FixJ family response regulator n=1 Tax=Azomonas macrocytogenes TaxID=69962 RepID=A0A839T7P7_AZOMA|nr:DNA-binding NarL/FixJ family response regulator [Azomonas macrocytogenes]